MMKSAAELRIGETQRRGLIKIRDLLRAGKVPHYNPPRCKYAKHMFNMGYWLDHENVPIGDEKTEQCGTIMCIGGLLEAMQINPCEESLEELYRPEDITGYEWINITPKQAARAIDNFLKSGKPRWRALIRKNIRRLRN